MRPGSCSRAMASSDLDHLKISYRTRFCCTSRVPDTHLWKGQNILENIQDCFEEKSYDTGFSTNPGSPTLCSTPYMLRNDSYSSPDKECQIAPSKSDWISSVKKKVNTPVFSPQSIMLQNQTNNGSAMSPEISQKLLQVDLVDLKNTPNLKYTLSGAKEFNKLPNETLEEFCLTVGPPGPLAKETEILLLPHQATPANTEDRWNHRFRNSDKRQPLLSKSSLKNKKSLNSEGTAVWSAEKKEEKDVKGSERQQKRKQSESSERRTEETKQKIQQKTKMNFSTLLLEAVKGNCRNSSVLRHVSSPQKRSPSLLPKDLESSSDEFIIDESDSSFSKAWILIPNKNSKSVKQDKKAPVENFQDPEGKKSRMDQLRQEKCNSANDKHPNTENRISDVINGEKTSKYKKHKAQVVEKSQPSKRKKLDNLSGEMGNPSKFTRHRIYSEKSEYLFENKESSVQHQTEKCETKIDNRQSDEGGVNFSDEKEASFHSEQNIAEVETSLRTTKSKINSLEKSQTTERKTFNKSQDREYKPKRVIKKNGMKHTNKKMCQTNQDKVQRESDGSLVLQEETAKSCHSAEQVLSAAGKEKKINCVPQQVQKKRNLNKTTSKNKKMSKKTEIIKQNLSQAFTITRSKRISKRPSDWWVVTTEQNNIPNSPVLELPVNHKNNPKPFKETKKVPPKTLEKGTVSLKQQKSSIRAEPKEVPIINKRRRRKFSYSSDENCDVDPTAPKLDEQEDSLKETPRKKNVPCSSTAESPEECISAVQKVILTPAVLTSDSKTSGTSTMEESGPARLRSNVLTTGNNKILGDEQKRTTGGFPVGGKITNDKVSPREKLKRKRENVTLDSYEDKQKKKALAALNMSLGDPFKPTCVFDPGREQMVFRDLVKLKGTHEFCVQDDTLKMFKILNTSLFATGTLILEPLKEKGKQYVCSDTVVFFVVSGDLICTLHETSYNLTTGDIFYVPSGNFYNIKNLLNERSILLFTQIKSERPER